MIAPYFPETPRIDVLPTDRPVVVPVLLSIAATVLSSDVQVTTTDKGSVPPQPRNSTEGVKD